MEIYAHRAGRGLAAENTLEACQTALEHAIDFIDFDICMSADGELVVSHDPLLNPDLTRHPDGRYIDEEIQVSLMKYDQLARFNVGQVNPLSPYAKYFPKQRSFPAARIPRLKEAILYVQKVNPRIRFQLEIKTDPTRPELTHTPEIFADALLHLLKETAILSTVEVQAFDYRCLLALQERHSEIKLAFLTHPFEEKASRDSVWHAGHHWNHFRSYPKMIHALGGHCWGPYQMDVTEENLAEAQELGLKVVAWGYPEKEGTEFNVGQIKKLDSWGIDGIITDRPDLMALAEWNKQ